MSLTLSTNADKQLSSTASKKELKDHKVHYIQKSIGGDTYLVMAQSVIELEDEWSNLYYTTGHLSNLFLMPPFEPNVLMNFAQTNNVLLQCIEAMEVNIDGTGMDFVAINDGDKVDKEEKKRAQAFFNEPYPAHSFVKIRRKLRRQMEQVGYGFLEILRNVGGDVVGLRNVETQHMRFVKLDAQVLVTRKVTRDGKEIELTMWERERRFAQRVALKTLVYYREFGTSRQINRETGDWETPGNPIPAEKRGTELICFGLKPDITTPYFVPRWINELPSVIGSRKAEEQNLQFLDSGGLPPAIIFIQGGTLAKDASDQLRTYLSGQNKNKYRAVVVEAQSSSGSLDAAGNVQVKVERFGSASAQDAMFLKYDVATEDHVRVGFRLPPLFLGQPKDYNMATAITAYMVAEAQVFAPERADFDSAINSTIMKELGFKTIRCSSNPITLQDVSNQMAGLGLAKDLATRESTLKEVNSITGMSLELAAIPQPDSVTATFTPDGTPVQESTVDPNTKTVSQTPHGMLPASFTHSNITPKQNTITPPPGPGAPTGKAPGPGAPNGAPAGKTPGQIPGKSPGAPAKTPKKASDIIALAHSYAALKGLVAKRELTPEEAIVLKEEMDSLTPDDTDAFNTLLASYTFGSDAADLVKLVAHH